MTSKHSNDPSGKPPPVDQPPTSAKPPMSAPPSVGDAAPSPRAFCQATGLVFQAAGFFLAISTCCWWSFTGRFQAELMPTEPDREAIVVSRDAPAELTWAMAAVCITFAGGLALTGVGMGLQHDRIRRGGAVMALTGLVAAFYWAYLIAAWVSFGGTGRMIIAAGLGLVWTVFFLLAGASAEQLRRHPPARTPEILTSRDADDLRNAISLRSRDKTNP